jgi:hypothetical protein
MKETKELEDCCQVCIYHKNKPSRCKEGEGWNYVPRKEKPCIKFRRFK